MKFHNSVMDFFAFSKNTPKRQCISDYFDIKMQNKSWFEGTTTTPFIPLSQIWRSPKFLSTRLGGHQTGMINYTASKYTKFNTT